MIEIKDTQTKRKMVRLVDTSPYNGVPVTIPEGVYEVLGEFTYDGETYYKVACGESSTSILRSSRFVD